MQAKDERFTQIINGTKQFVIPVFQRDYSWTEEQCRRLWDDVIDVGRGAHDRKHFVGSLVYVASEDMAAGFPRWLLIDGQQRVTTLTLLIVALRDHLLATQWQSDHEDAPSAKRLMARFLRNTEEDGQRAQKLVLRRRDHSLLQALIDAESRPADDTSRILENYDYFRERLAEPESDPLTVYRGIDRLVFVDVRLDRHHDDPQMIFESLNSTGVDLSQSDLIRNFILMRVPEQRQTHLHEKYWARIDELFRDAGATFDAFARDYLALRMQSSKLVRNDQIYREFRSFFRTDEETLGVEGALSNLLRFAEYHVAFSLGKGNDKAALPHLQRLKRLADVAAVLVLRLSDYRYRAGTLSSDEFIAALQLLESYVFRRSVCSLSSQGYNQMFASLALRVDEASPLRSLKVALARLSEKQRFPTDDEFRREMTSRDLYTLRTCHYLLDRLENHGSNEPTDTSAYTVEHIMPQNEKLAPAWREMLGSDWRKIHAEWLHRLGNLTLTGYNAKYSDKPFEQKKAIKDGLQESSVRLNRFVREQPRWTPVEMEARGNDLAARAIQVWPALNVNSADVAAAEHAELAAKAGKRNVSQVPLSDRARDLLHQLRPALLALSDGIVEVPESKTVSYYEKHDFFLEVLPRKKCLILLLDLEHAECEFSDQNTHDAGSWKFLFYAEHTGGVTYTLEDAGHIEAAMKLIRQAWQQARS